MCGIVLFVLNEVIIVNLFVRVQHRIFVVDIVTFE